jgi:phage tail-like protein
MAKEALATILVTSADGTEEKVSIEMAEFQIGRSPDNDLVLQHTKVSRRHARLEAEKGKLSLFDLNSSNGTWIGENRIPPDEPQELKKGDTFRIGDFTISLLDIAEPPSPPPEPAPKTKTRAKPAPPKPESKEAPPVKEPEEKPVKITAREKKPPPRPSRAAAKGPPPPPIDHTALDFGDNGYSRYDEALGVPEDVSRYMKYLPPLYHDAEFLGRFLLAFEAILTPIEQNIDHFDFFLDPKASPESFLPTLARWVGLTLDEKIPPDKLREILAQASDLYRKRGTKKGMTKAIEIYTGVAPKISEPKDRPHFFKVSLTVPRKQKVDPSIVERLIQASKPAHATFELNIQHAK